MSIRSTRKRLRLPSRASVRCLGLALCVHWPGPGRSHPPLVAIVKPAGYGYNASAINSSDTLGPYESAVSIRFTPSSTARRSVASAAALSAGGPQIPVPVMRIAPYPNRLTVRSPPIVRVPEAAAEIVCPLLIKFLLFVVDL